MCFGMKYVRGVRLTLVAGRWSLVAGRWSLVAGRWSLVAGRWSLVAGRWSLVAKDCGRGGVSVKRLRVFFIDSVLRPQLPEQFSMTGL